MHNKFATTVVLVVLAGLVVSIASTARAEDNGCSALGASGKYGFTTTGTIVGLGPASAVGTFGLDAAGNVVGAQTSSFNGVIVNETLSGTATVSQNCTGTATISVFHAGALVRTTNLNLAYVDNQREIRMIFLTPTTVLTVNARKTSTKEED